MPSPFRTEVLATARLAGPLVGGQIAMMGLNFIDTVMAGRLSAEALAAVAVGSSVWASISIFLMGTLMALPPAVARHDGAGQRKRLTPLVVQSLWLSLLLSALGIVAALNLRPLLEVIGVEARIVPDILGYLRALAWGVPGMCGYMVLRFTCEGLGFSRPTLYFGLLALPVNALANYALMYGRLGLPELGAVGCGHATAVVWWVQFFALAVYFRAHPLTRDLRIFERLERPRARAIGAIAAIGAPIGAALFVEGSLFTIAALFIGSLGVVPVAAHQLALNFVGITFMVPLGISMAISVRVGHSLGRGSASGVRRAALAGGALVMLSQVTSATVMLVFPEAVAAIYTTDAAVTALAVELLFLGAVFQLSDGVQVSFAGALRGIGDTRAMMLITVAAYWLLGLPAGAWLCFSRELGARGMWIGLITGLSVAALLLVLRFAHSSSQLAGARRDAEPAAID